MAGEIYEIGFSGNQPRILARQMMIERSPYLFYRKWMGFNTTGGAVDPQKAVLLPNTPIVVHQELKREGGNQLKVPMARRLINKPKTGRAQLSGHEELVAINHSKVYIELLRHAVRTQEGSLSALTMDKQYQLSKKYKPLLGQHYSETANFMQIPCSLYKGQAWNVLDAGNNTSLAAISHPNIWVAGFGKVGSGTNYPGVAGYETEIGTQINAMGVSHVFDTELLMALKTDSVIMKIPPLLTKNGDAYRIIVANPRQIYDLKKDPKFEEAMFRTLAQNYAKENPYLVGCKYYYDGWAIFDGQDVVWPVTVSGGVPVWGPTTETDLSSFQNYSAYDTFAAQILGDNALAKATGTAMEFIAESRDYKEVTGMGYRIIEGYGRNDYWNEDDGTTGQHVINDTSGLIVTKIANMSW